MGRGGCERAGVVKTPQNPSQPLHVDLSDAFRVHRRSFADACLCLCVSISIDCVGRSGTRWSRWLSSGACRWVGLWSVRETNANPTPTQRQPNANQRQPSLGLATVGVGRCHVWRWVAVRETEQGRERQGRQSRGAQREEMRRGRREQTGERGRERERKLGKRGGERERESRRGQAATADPLAGVLAGISGRSDFLFRFVVAPDPLAATVVTGRARWSWSLSWLALGWRWLALGCWPVLVDVDWRFRLALAQTPTLALS